tara:strand:- start:448029 stop:448406 length:378 start_codon:yes stop_codon:yes gene_type:complete
MTRHILLAAGLLTAAFVSTGTEAKAGDPYAMTQVWAHNFSMDRPWHGGYYAQSYGQPTAVVVPPTAHMRQSYSWGVSQNLMYPIHHQFGRSANSPGAAPGGRFRATPPWPSHTDQFGYYYVRSPW